LTKRTWAQPDPSWRPLRQLLDLRRPRRDPEREADRLIAAGGLGHDRRENLVRFVANREQRRPPIGPDQARKFLDWGIPTGKIVVFARCPITASFRQLQPDVWAALKVTNWEEGVAVAPDGTVYSSIHFRAVDRESSGPLRKATRDEVSDEIAATYDEAEAKKTKPPNLSELPTAVGARLKKKGCTATKETIRKIGGLPRFCERRLKRGPPFSRRPA
jgi:hypothetical protein